MKKIILSIAIALYGYCAHAQWLNQSGTNNYYLTPGNVGIGTTPSYKLDVLGPISGGVNDYSYNAAVYQLTNQSRVDGISGVSPTGAFRWYTNPNNSFKNGFLYQLRSYDTYNGESDGLLTVRGDGNVSIGTTSFLQKFTIKSPGTLTGSSSSDYDFGITDGASLPLQLLGLVNTSSQYGLLQVVKGGGGPGNLVLQTQGGNVGIGATSPGNKLTVYLSSGTGNVISWGNVGGGMFGALGFDGTAHIYQLLRVQAVCI